MERFREMLTHHHAGREASSPSEHASVLALMLHLQAAGHTTEAKQLDTVFKFSSKDPLWVEAFTSWASQHELLAHEVARHSHVALKRSFQYPMSDDITIALLGDFATGNQQCYALSRELVRTTQPKKIIHLGDVYYCGSAEEYEQNFTRPLVSALGVTSAAELRDVVYNLPGNHDYYSDGKAFFNTCCDLIGSQEGSYWSLSNTYYCVIGLDTALNDSNPVETARDSSVTFVPQPQLQWAKNLIRDAKQNGRGVILMSHHMPFSAHELSHSQNDGDGKASWSYVNHKLLANFQEELAMIDFWFFGHEHAWTRYGPYAGIERAYLLGNGSVPCMPSDKPYDVKTVAGETPPPILSPQAQTFHIENVEVFCNGGYALRFNGPSLQVQYYELHQRGDQGLEFGLDTVPGELQIFENNNGTIVEVGRQ